ncbi:MAG TPA: hypothetical protein VMR52_07635 [Dehalococcoidia bacterium]|nr:hypothetical protein [Dehalococcoidia bacterium]
MDLTKLPVGEAIIGFLVAATVVTFAVAFAVVEPGSSPAEETPAGDDDDNGGAPTLVDGAVEIVMGDNFFRPTDVTVTAGETVTFNLENQGAAIHNMHIAGPDGEYAVSGLCETGGEEPCSDPDTMPGGSTGILEWNVPADAAGSQIPFRCDFHVVEMTGTITVQ